MKFNLQLFLEKAKSLKATDIRKRKITPIKEDTPLIEIFNKISTKDLPIIPVINEKKEYIGIVTLRDLLFLFQKRHTSGSEVFQNPVTANFTAEDLINANLPVIYDDDSLETIAENMSK
ncbi:MAG: CBS domain-containing protein, partial [Candidatus Heimdallarchaeota archaeon]